MITKKIFFIIFGVWNMLFFFLCGYWQQMDFQIDLGVDFAFGIVAIILLALGEASVAQQIYMSHKYKTHKMQVFEYKLVRQIVLLVVFHVGVFLLMSNLINIHGIFYISAWAMFLSTGWVKGSEILWTGEESSYYLVGSGKVYNVENVMENTKVFELSCTRKGERDRVITIEKKEAIDEQSRLR